MPKNWISSNKNEQNHFLVNKNFESNVIERHYEKKRKAQNNENHKDKRQRRRNKQFWLEPSTTHELIYYLKTTSITLSLGNEKTKGS